MKPQLISLLKTVLIIHSQIKTSIKLNKNGDGNQYNSPVTWITLKKLKSLKNKTEKRVSRPLLHSILT
jgi:hypothetical protein